MKLSLGRDLNLGIRATVGWNWGRGCYAEGGSSTGWRNKNQMVKSRGKILENRKFPFYILFYYILFLDLILII